MTFTDFILYTVSWKYQRTCGDNINMRGISREGECQEQRGAKILTWEAEGAGLKRTTGCEDDAQSKLGRSNLIKNSREEAGKERRTRSSEILEDSGFPPDRGLLSNCYGSLIDVVDFEILILIFSILILVEKRQEEVRMPKLIFLKNRLS
jgi:hypothetical protein